MTLLLAAALASIVLIQAQLYDKVIETEYGPMKGFKYFNESTLKTNWGTSDSSDAWKLGRNRRIFVLGDVTMYLLVLSKVSFYPRGCFPCP